jgi:CRP-like cAMP-binding protein
MMRLVKKVKEASKGEFSMDFMVPFMNKEDYKPGDVVFKKGDQADKLYYLQSGSIRLAEIDKILTEGEVIGEMGIFSPEKVRTATVVCETDAVLFNIPESKVTEIYFQNPEFGFYLVQLILKRVAARTAA